jgi:hypothetical protein
MTPGSDKPQLATRRKWHAIRRRVRLECEGIRPEVEGFVQRAMERTGFAASAEDAAARAATWYTWWVDKVVDEETFVTSDSAARAEMVKMVGVESFTDCIDRGEFVLLVGWHDRTHSLGLMRLDDLGIATTILVHEAMIPIIGEYGLRHAEFIGPGRSVMATIRRKASEGGVLATYLDAAADGNPLSVEGGRIRAERPFPIERIAVAAEPRVFEWRLAPRYKQEPCYWRVDLIDHGRSPDRTTTIIASFERRLRAAPEHWMLWRRVPEGVD